MSATRSAAFTAVAVVLTTLGLGAQPQRHAAAVTPVLTASLVRTVATSAWSPASPDPDGLVYLPSADRLLVSDSEVDEMGIFNNVNMWNVTRAGVVQDTGVTTSYTDEPDGLAYNASTGHIFIADDDQLRVYEDAPGADGRYGTADDSRTWFSTYPYSTDPEEVTYFPPTGELFLLDAADNDIYRIGPGPNGTFDGIAPAGDDTIAEFDVGVYGAELPEGTAYFPSRGTLLVVDEKSSRVYEFTRQMQLANIIDISASKQVKAAGIAVAPATNDASRNDLYIVDRGIDNNNAPTENDGKMYEMSVSFPALPNLAPTVALGRDTATHVNEAITLTAAERDDGRPNPPNTLTTTWAEVSGPGTVVFGTPSQPQTTATFNAVGTYVVRATASDSALGGSDDIAVSVVAAGAALPFAIPVTKVFDDVEEQPSGYVSWLEGTLNIPNNGSTHQTVGVRFTGLPVPNGATVTSAWIQFQTRVATSGTASILIQGDAADDAAEYFVVSKDVSSRPRTTHSVTWSPPAWSTVGQAGSGQQTVDLSAIVQEIVNRSGWHAGNAMSFVFTGSGERDAESHPGGKADPVLHIAFTVPSGGNSPPTASFTFGCTGVICSFNGTGSKDSDGSIMTYAWSFGDGKHSTKRKPSHTYATAGTRSVTLTVTDNGGATGSVTKPVTVS
ncbi:MAG: PKD domain-containing protein [Actinomycetes bacterium]